MNNGKVIAFVGMPGAGKGTCTSYLEKEKGWPVFHFGNMVYEEVQKRGLDNVKDEVFVREDMRHQEGPAVLAIHAAQHADEALKKGAQSVILDGLYSWTEYQYLANRFGDQLVVIAVVAPKELRRKRVLDRKDSHRSYTHEQLVLREVAEIENLEKGGPIAYADYYLLNDTDAKALLAQLKEVLNTLGL